MPGFCGIVGKFEESKLFNKDIRTDLINNKFNINDIYIEQRTIDKFKNDKVFQENDDYFILTEGVILNSNELKEKYKCDSLFKTIIKMYIEKGNDFFEEFRGSFSGFFYDKKNNKKIIYTDHIGDKQIFFYNNEESLIFGSEINYIISYFKNNNIHYELDVDSVYFLITYGYMLEENTTFKQIKKLLPGSYIVIEKGEVKISQYYRLNNTLNTDESEEEIIENIDILFRQAVKRAFEKDKEYGYKHLVGLSGGLDSRMTTWVANDMGYGDNIVNFTFSQSNYLDETIPKSIASDLKHEWIFKSLDNGIFLKNIDEIVKISSGGALYYGLAHSKSCLDLIDKKKFGVIHTGQLGDVIIGTFFSTLDKNKKYSLNDGVYSNLLINKIKSEMIKNEYENEEIFKFYGRGFLGANQGLLVYQETNETYSPFYDVDLMDYCLTIPVKYRLNHDIYYKWIINKYPDAAKYKWEKINAKITDKNINLLGKKVVVRKLPRKIVDVIKRKMKINISSLETKNNMNPLDYWYNTNENLRTYINNYYNENIDRISFDNDLLSDCKYLFEQGKFIEKNQVLTLLALLKIYF